MSSALNCWTITNGSAGMESQVRGVAEALLPLYPGGLEIANPVAATVEEGVAADGSRIG